MLVRFPKWVYQPGVGVEHAGSTGNSGFLISGGSSPVYWACTYASQRDSRELPSTVSIRYWPNSALVATVSRPVLTIFFSCWPQTSRALCSLGQGSPTLYPAILVPATSGKAGGNDGGDA